MPERDDEKAGQFQEVYEEADDEVAGVGSIAHDDDAPPKDEKEPPAPTS